MPEAVNQAYIFLPMLALVALSFAAFLRMGMMRAAAVKGGQDPTYYRAHLGDPEPEATVAAVRHYGNLFELPTLFYAGCLTAFVLGAVSVPALVFAWAFVAARVVQSTVHLSYNNPAHRGLAFTVGVFALLALWVGVAFAIFAKL